MQRKSPVKSLSIGAGSWGGGGEGRGVLDSDCVYRESELRLLDKNTGDHRDIQKKDGCGTWLLLKC